MNLAVEMPVRGGSLSTESPEQDADVNEYYEYCLELRMKTSGRIISLPRMTPGTITYRWIMSHAFNKPQSY